MSKLHLGGLGFRALGGCATLIFVGLAANCGGSTDGTRIIYSDNAHGGRKITDVSIAKTDGTGAQKSVRKDRMENTAAGKCQLNLAFAGTKALVGHCVTDVVAPGDAGTDAGSDAATDATADTGDAAAPTGTPATTSLDDGTGAVTDVLSNAVNQFSTDDAETKLFVL